MKQNDITRYILKNKINDFLNEIENLHPLSKLDILGNAFDILLLFNEKNQKLNINNNDLSKLFHAFIGTIIIVIMLSKQEEDFNKLLARHYENIYEDITELKYFLLLQRNIIGSLCVMGSFCFENQGGIYINAHDLDLVTLFLANSNPTSAEISVSLNSIGKIVACSALHNKLNAFYIEKLLKKFINGNDFETVLLVIMGLNYLIVRDAIDGKINATFVNDIILNCLFKNDFNNTILNDIKMINEKSDRSFLGSISETIINDLELGLRLESAKANLADEKMVDVSKDCMCHLTSQIFIHPITLSNGETYELFAIKKLANDLPGETFRCPKTGDEINKMELHNEVNQIIKASSIKYIENLEKGILNSNPSDYLSESMICPLSGQHFIVPITLSTGYTYEKDELLKLEIHNNKFTCPKSGKEVDKDELNRKPCLVIQALSETLQEKNLDQENAFRMI